MKKLSFTLAEVLITLAIIGIIAALTIPNLLKNYQKQVWVTGLQKNYNIIQNAVAQAEKENGYKLFEDKITDASTETARLLNKYIIPYVKIAKDCTKDDNNDNCTSVNRYDLASNTQISAHDIKNKNYITAFTLQDGTLIGGFTNGAKNHLVLIVDTNGDKKPNTLGRDIFWIGLFFNERHDNYARKGVGGVYLWGAGNTRDELTKGTDPCNTKANPPNSSGGKCASLILIDGWKMNY